MIEVFSETQPVYLLHYLWLTSSAECQQDSTLVGDNCVSGADVLLGYLVTALEAVPWHIWHMKYLNVI